MYHSDSGHFWEVYFTGEEDYVERRTIEVDVHIGRSTGTIVGLTINDWQLAETEEREKAG